MFECDALSAAGGSSVLCENKNEKLRNEIMGEIVCVAHKDAIVLANLFAITDFDAFVAETAFFVVFDGCVMVVDDGGIHQGKRV